MTENNNDTAATQFGDRRREVIWIAVVPDGDNHMVIGRSQDTGQFETIEGIASAGAAVAEARRLLESRGYVAHVCDVHEAADVMADWQACHAITNQE